MELLLFSDVTIPAQWDYCSVSRSKTTTRSKQIHRPAAESSRMVSLLPLNLNHRDPHGPNLAQLITARSIRMPRDLLFYRNLSSASREFASIRGSNGPFRHRLRGVTENECDRLPFEILVRRVASAEHIRHQVHDLVLSQQPQ